MRSRIAFPAEGSGRKSSQFTPSGMTGSSGRAGSGAPGKRCDRCTSASSISRRIEACTAFEVQITASQGICGAERRSKVACTTFFVAVVWVTPQRAQAAAPWGARRQHSAAGTGAGKYRTSTGASRTAGPAAPLAGVGSRHLRARPRQRPDDRPGNGRWRRIHRPRRAQRSRAESFPRRRGGH